MYAVIYYDISHKVLCCVRRFVAVYLVNYYVIRSVAFWCIS